MADKKISALPPASTPLAGTEVLPIVQGGITEQVSVSDLTNGRDVLAANLGIGGAVNVSYKVTSYGAIYSTTGASYFAGTLGVGTTPVYKLDVVVGGGAQNMFRAGQSGISNGLTIVSDGTNLTYQFDNGNLVVGTAGKGITTGGATALGFGVNNAVDAMTIDTSKNVGVGTASPLATSGRNITISSVESSLALVSTGAKSYSIASGGNFQYTGNALCFIDNAASATRMLLTTDGEFWIANLADQGAYNLQVGGTGVWGAGAYVNGSDARLKDDVAPLAPALDVVNSLNPVTFRYKADYSKDQSVQPGFIAQELQEALADQAYVDGVVQAGPEYLNVAYQSLIPVLVKAIQELSAQVAELQAK